MVFVGGFVFLFVGVIGDWWGIKWIIFVGIVVVIVG